MSVFTSLEIFIISGLIIASLKLIPGIFALFYHYASGKYPAKKVSDLSIFFILGVETLPVLVFIILSFASRALLFTDITLTENITIATIAGLLFALSFSIFFFYFRRSKGTELFISRKTAKRFIRRASNVKKRSNAFFLGLTSGLPELIFTLPLYLIIFIEASNNFKVTSSSAILLAFVLFIIAPIFLTYAYFRNGNNLANFERLRVKNKFFFRSFIASLYALLAILLIIFRMSLWQIILTKKT